MGELAALIRFLEGIDAETFSLDLRMRVLREVEAGVSRREAAECVEVSASSAIKWMQRSKRNRKHCGQAERGSISPLEAHAAVLLGLIAEQADLTLDEIVAVMRKRRIAGSRSAVWRFFKRHNVSFKKICAQRSSSEPMCPRPAALDARTRHV